MTDFSSLLAKINALKALVEHNSITPTYLGSLLEDIVAMVQAVDMTGMSDDVQAAIRNASSALSNASQALAIAFAAQSTATTAQNIAYNAYTTANNANDNAVKALYLADTGSKELKALKEHIGTPSGIAPLDEWGKISNGYFQAAMVAVTAMEPTWSLPKGEPGNIAVAYVPHEGGAVSPRFMRCNNAGE